MQTSTAIATVIIAAIVAWISGQQWIINKEKFRLDLYNRRFDIYVAALDSYKAISADLQINEINDAQDAFLRAFREALFLFPKESGVLALLDEFQKRESEIHVFKYGPQTNMLDMTEFGEKNIQNIKWMNAFLPQLEEKIAPYLNFHDYKEHRGLYQTMRQLARKAR